MYDASDAVCLMRGSPLKPIFTADNLHHSNLLLENVYRVAGFRALVEKGAVKLMIIMITLF